MADRSHTARVALRRAATSLLLLSLCAAPVSIVLAADLGLITAGEKGTYYQLGQDMKTLVKPSGINLTIHASNGSVDNLAAVHHRRGVQLGIVQSDVLAVLAEVPRDTVAWRIGQSIRMVFPLHTEEVHILGRRELRDFEQLADRRVAIGLEGSGTYLTARRLFKLAGVKPRELLPLDVGDALSQLKAGHIDALIYVAASPVSTLRDRISVDDGVALLTVSHNSILEVYETAEIPTGRYPWQTAPLTALALKAVLVTADRADRDCEALGRFASEVTQGMEWLRQHGHQKWNSVDLNPSLAGWKQDDCVRNYLGRGVHDSGMPAASPRERNPVAEAIKKALGEE